MASSLVHIPTHRFTTYARTARITTNPSSPVDVVLQVQVQSLSSIPLRRPDTPVKIWRNEDGGGREGTGEVFPIVPISTVMPHTVRDGTITFYGSAPK